MPMKPGSDVAFEKRVLERLQVHSQMRVDRTAFHNLRFEAVGMDTAADMVFRLSAYVWQEVIQDETATLKVEYPADWWQHIKQRWFPAWALRRWPVRMKAETAAHTFKTCALLPGFRYESPPNTGPYVIHVSTERKWP